MQWNLLGETKVELMDAEEACNVQPFSLYPARFPGMESCMHFCENLGGSRVPPVTTLLQWEKLSLFAGRPKGEALWLLIHDNQNEGVWRDFYNSQVPNYTFPWLRNEPNGGTSENCAIINLPYTQYPGWVDYGCPVKNFPYCLCERDPSFHLELRGLCADSAIDKYFRAKL